MFNIGKKFCREGHVMDPTWDVCPVCIAPIRGWLVWIQNGLAIRVFNIHEGKMLIGAGSDCEIRLQAKGIKRHHAQLLVSPDGVQIVKVTQSGTLTVNYHDTASNSLIDGDMMSLGEQEFKFKCL